MSKFLESATAIFEGVPVINVGVKGGDLQTRLFTAAMIVLLVALVAPPFGVSDTVVNIVTLAVAMAGTVFLMTGLVFAARTHYAGIVLTALPLVLKLLAGLQARWIAVVIGLAALAGSIHNLSTRRCGLNKILRISSV